jgi:hypothetical protein
MAHRSSSSPPEAFSPSFSPLRPWIHGPFLAIEFAVAPSSSPPNSGDPGATLARASLNSGDLTAAERNNAARSRPSPWSDSLRPIQIARPGPRVPLRARAPDAQARLSAPKHPGTRPARSARSPPLSLALPGPACQRSLACARAPSTADLISVVGFRSDG